MGDIFSDSEESTSNTTNNSQVAQQGTGNAASRVLEGAQAGYAYKSNIHGDIIVSVENSDREVVMRSLETAAKSSVAGALAAVGATDAAKEAATVAGTVAAGGLALAGKGFDLAQNVTADGFDAAQNLALGSNQVALQALNYSALGIDQALQTLQGVTNRSAELAEMAVGAAQQTALNAAPVSPGAYAEAIAGQGQNFSKWLLIAGVGLVVFYIVKK